MRTIEDRKIRKVLLAVLVPVWVFIFAMWLMGGAAPQLYTDVDMRALCGYSATKPADWKYIVLHHSATAGGNAGDFDRFHRSKGWDELAYHFVIGNGNRSGDGKIEVGDRWRAQKPGAHAGNELFNNHGIGICLVGDFEKGDRPTDAQIDALIKLCTYLMRTYEIPAASVMRHSDVSETKCPGTNFPFAELVQELKAGMAADVAAETSPSQDL